MNILVTGGGGFLGSHLARRLCAMGHQVTVLGRRQYKSLPEGMLSLQADLRDSQAIQKACRSRDAVFHSGALTGIWGKKRDFEQINVDGTRNVIHGCLNHGVRTLVFTSSPSVVYGSTDMENVDESIPYPTHYLSHYPRTKALAEQRVMAANGKQGLRTVSLRPHLIWGPGDPHLVPRVIARARKGQLVRVGEGKNKVDLNYIDNAVEGHIRAWQALEDGSPVDGKCYFLSDGQPVNLWDWINDLLTALNIAPVTRSIPYPWARILGGMMEWTYRALQMPEEPRMTRFLAGQLATSHYFNIERARKDFNYKAVVSPEEGMKRLLSSLQAPPDG
ncbi:MAG: NAD-dependent epimerase/dehydratase family protein [Nitrospinaceae bacterium]|nr:NAD-dependent epimerase/dehydratase family protein [Nitrospinaceae bacterium]NIR55923.1 NAD-dependent epimerase/dehydratase family protein [Nitrospinaceae bacterium]NIS86370.1 NAD-dependent epimerase/dehydratase family protein [Nitrospinaceae bacterium]NIT83203.1 NAD-dependent epimerase/dehydratase family protein [Nitrospinaceae bacterium]NIU45417.1 NAD-dependent epimerase/dehydratase family protein [Nitrospinaceae bacterium]